MKPAITKKSSHKMLNISVSILVVVLILGFAIFSIYSSFFDPYRGSTKTIEESLPLESNLSKKEASEDILFFVAKIKSRHPLWLEKKASIQKAIEDKLTMEIENLSDEPTVLEVWQKISSISALLHDGHTYAFWKNSQELLFIHDFSQIKEYGDPIQINGFFIEDIYSRYLKLNSYESDSHAKKRFSNSIIVTKSLLELCGISTTSGITMDFNTPRGIQTYHYFFVPLPEVTGRSENSDNDTWVSFNIDTKNSIGIFTLKSCNSNDEYRKVLDSFFAEIFSRNIKTLAIDLRGNSGGNSWVANEFLTYIAVEKYKSWDCSVRYGPILWKNRNNVYENKKKAETFAGNIFVLTDVYTYSSAMDFAMLIQDNNLGKIVGEASGNSPDSYGDCIYFQLPNSKIALSVSFKKWYRVDQTKDGTVLRPDFSISPERALEKVYELIE